MPRGLMCVLLGAGAGLCLALSWAVLRTTREPGLRAAQSLLSRGAEPRPPADAVFALRPGMERESGPGGGVAPAEDVDRNGADSTLAGITRGSREPVAPRSSPSPKPYSLEGRVLFPLGMPPGERVVVVADTWHFRQSDDVRALVGPDGSFQLGLESGSLRIKLDLEAPSLLLQEPLKLRPSGHVGPVVLRPQLAGRIRGRVSIPVERMPGAKHGRVRANERTTEICPDLTFEFDHLPAGQYRLRFQPPGFTPAEALVELAGGQELDVELAVHVGVSVVGWVQDESGMPLPHAEVRVTCSGDEGREIRVANGRVPVDAQGAFRLDALPAGGMTVTASCPGYVEASLELGSLADRAVCTGIGLVLERGSSIAGIVVSPDKSSVEGAEFLVRDEKTGREFRYSRRGDLAFVDPDGRFELTGLPAGPFFVEVRLRTGQATEPEPGVPLPGTDLRAVAESVPAGSTGLVLRPRPPADPR